MSLVKKLMDGSEKIAIVGLGYVGLPIAIAFSKKVKVIGFDINKEKINEYKRGKDSTGEFSDEEMSSLTIDFTTNETKIKEAKIIIIAVPTPINADKTPNLEAVLEASRLVGRNLSKGVTVVYESTVYPGVTEDVCIPELEKISGKKCPQDFSVGYSPERINPGDKIHRLETIKKIVSGIDSQTLKTLTEVYGLVIDAGVHKASSIKVAEAAKVVENSQRDINIAFMNELAMVFDRMDIDTKEVLEAMNTKWNALGFSPGLVGGHCIGVDPYYFIYEAERLGYHSQIILSGRKINDGVAQFIGETVIKKLVLANKLVKQAKIAILGVTFKENCADIRNSKVEDIVKSLKEYGITPEIVDPLADKEIVKEIYGQKLLTFEELTDIDCFVCAVAHDSFKNLTMEEFIDKASNKNSQNIMIDIKGVYEKDSFEDAGYVYWRL